MESKKQNQAEKLGIIVNLKTIRVQKGMTQDVLGWIVKLNSSRISKIESGCEIPSVVVANKIAKALGTTTFDIWKES